MASRPNVRQPPNLHQKLLTLIQGALTDTGGAQKLAAVDRRTTEKALKLTDKVVKLCQHPRMNIKNSPPFILDILPDTNQHLKLILTHYEDRMGQLASNEYFVCFIDNLINKCRKCKKVQLRGNSFLGLS
jgi:DNA-directed RNA polymerase subunit F